MNTINFDRTTDDLVKRIQRPDLSPERRYAVIKEALRLVWNARGAADIAKLEIELLSRNATAQEGPLTRALRSIDRQDDGT